MNRIADLLTRIVADAADADYVTITDDEERFHAATDRRRLCYHVEKTSITMARIQRHPLLGQGSAIATKALDLFMLEAEEVRTALTGLVEADLKVLRRNMALEAQGVDVDDPGPEHLEMHPLARHFALAAGLDIEAICRSDRDDDDAVVRDERGILTRAARSEVAGLRVTCSHHHADGKLVAAEMEAYMPGEASIRFVNDGDAILLIEGASVPETLVSSLPGRPLGDLLSHPLTDGYPGLITGARNRATTGRPRIEIELGDGVVRASDGKPMGGK